MVLNLNLPEKKTEIIPILVVIAGMWLLGWWKDDFSGQGKIIILAFTSYLGLRWSSSHPDKLFLTKEWKRFLAFCFSSAFALASSLSVFLSIISPANWQKIKESGFLNCMEIASIFLFLSYIFCAFTVFKEWRTGLQPIIVNGLIVPALKKFEMNPLMKNLIEEFPQKGKIDFFCKCNGIKSGLDITCKLTARYRIKFGGSWLDKQAFLEELSDKLYGAVGGIFKDLTNFRDISAFLNNPGISFLIQGHTVEFIGGELNAIN